jgi:hypothetical protein
MSQDPLCGRVLPAVNSIEPASAPNSHVSVRHHTWARLGKGESHMTNEQRAEVGRITVSPSMLLLIVAPVLALGCASAGQGWSHVSQSTTGVSRIEGSSGSWERVEALQPGTALVVTLKSGERIAACFTSLHPTMLGLVDRDGRDSSVPRSDVARIVAGGPKDSLTNGALSGAGIGAAAAVVILAVIAAGNGYVLPSAKWGAPLLLSSVGGVLGALIDRAHNSEQLLYLAD